MSGTMRIVAGSGAYAQGAHAELAIRIADFARRLGMTVGTVKASRCATSPSRYVNVRDARGRPWIIRVSNHRKPDFTGHETPHFDLVSIDGIAGYDEACRVLGRIQAGGIDWFDPKADVRQPRRRR
jgi:hypothetical protein